MKLERVPTNTERAESETRSNVVSFPRFAPSVTSAERIGFVDNAKAIGILLVVLGHASGTPFSVRTLIYAVHMPLFFFLSGYLFSSARIEEPLIAHARRLARSLLAPYLIFFLLSYVYWLCTRNIGARALKFQHISWADPLVGLFTGLGQDMFVNPALWFLPCLFTVTLGYCAFRKALGYGTTLAVATVGALVIMFAIPENHYRLPWGLDNGWVALVFFAAAVTVRRESSGLKNRSMYWRLALSAVLLSSFAMLAYRTGPVDLNMAIFGASPTMYFVTAGTGIAAIGVLSSLWSPGALATWLSRNTLIIFPTHPIVMNFASGLAKLAFKMPDSALNSVGWAVFSSSLGVAAALPIGYVLRRTLPSVFPQTRK